MLGFWVHQIHRVCSYNLLIDVRCFSCGDVGISSMWMHSSTRSTAYGTGDYVQW